MTLDTLKTTDEKVKTGISAAPWTYELREAKADCCGTTLNSIGYVKDANHREIAVLYRTECQAANAQGIASLPDLIEALQTTAGNIRSLGPAGALDRIPEPYTVWLRVVEDALAKAGVR